MDPTAVPNWAIGIAQRAPELLVLAWIVNRFLLHLRAVEDACHTITAAATKTIGDNTMALGDVAGLLREMKHDRGVNVRRPIEPAHGD